MKVYLVIQVHHGVFEDVDAFLDPIDAGERYNTLKSQFKHDLDMELTLKEEDAT